MAYEPWDNGDDLRPYSTTRPDDWISGVIILLAVIIPAVLLVLDLSGVIDLSVFYPTDNAYTSLQEHYFE